MSLQLLENKALSWGIIGKSAPILAEITIRKSQVRRLPDDGDLVIDGLRFPEDHAFLVESFGPAFLHIHIDAPSTIRLERSISAGGTREEFFQAMSRPTEANVSKLMSLAHFIVPNVNGSESFL